MKPLDYLDSLIAGIGISSIPIQKSELALLRKFIEIDAAQGRANTLVPDAQPDPDQWRELLEAVLREMPSTGARDNGNAPGHSHSRPGIWDSDNGAKAGTACAWCLAWNMAKKALISD